MSTYTVRPLSDRTWLRPAHERVTTRFSAKWAETEQLLLDEVDRLDGRDLVIEVDLREQDLRLDGTIRANAREAETPAVVVAFESRRHGPMLYRCDTFEAPYSWQGPHWQHNVRAIALTLQSLRAVDRYGATETGQQYAGFKALPAGRAMPASHMTRTAAAEVLERIAIGDEGPARARTLAAMANDPAVVVQIWKEARKVAHPDRRGGDHTVWDQVEQAARVLGVGR